MDLLRMDEVVLTLAVSHRCSVEKVFLKISQNSQENTCTRVPFLVKLQAPPATYNFIKKETLTQVFSCKFCEIFKNMFFKRTPLVAASKFTANILNNAQEDKSFVLKYDKYRLNSTSVLQLQMGFNKS